MEIADDPLSNRLTLRPPSSQNLEVFSNELTDSLSKANESTNISFLWVILILILVSLKVNHNMTKHETKIILFLTYNL